MPQNPKEYCFEEFRLSTSQRCLFRAGERVSITRTEYEMLLIFLESGGQVIPKDELYRRLWGSRPVDESNLFQHIRALRRKLGTTAAGQAYIETVYGIGYRFSATVRSEAEELSAADRLILGDPAKPDIEVNSPPKSIAAIEPRPERKKPWMMAALIFLALFVLVLATTLLLVRRNPGKPHLDEPPRSQEAMVISPAETQTAPRLLRSIKLKSPPAGVILAPGGKNLYAAELMGDAISVIDTTNARVTDRIHVSHRPYSMALSPDGKKLYVAQKAGGMTVIDTATKLATAVENMNEPVNDVVATRDGKSVYLALGFSGLAKLDPATGSITVISRIVYAEALALTPDGRRLYVSYQASGPGGSPGHDAIGYFDTATDQLAGVVPGRFPNVGGPLAVSPGGSQVWENGGDACSSPRYDHQGCPFAPTGLMHIFGTGTHPHVRNISLRSATMGCLTFSPKGDVALVGMTDYLLLMRSDDLRVIGRLPASSGRAAFTEDGALAYVPLAQKPEVQVIQIAIQVRAFRMTNRGESDGTFPVAIASSRELEAKFIDPTTLRMGKETVKRTPEGLTMASVEQITGYEGVNLIVFFSKDVLKDDPTAVLEGMTYSGVPIRGRIASR